MIYRYFRFCLIAFFLVICYLNFSHIRYKNIGDFGEPDLAKLIKWKFLGNKPHWPELPNKKTSEEVKIEASLQEKEIIVTYINHATTLIQMEEKNILTDPIWSEYAGPYGKFGVKRSIYPGVEMEQLPKIDFILISHSHYDHLDLPSIERLVEKHQPKIITGLGVTKYIDYCRVRNRCYELDWWDKAKFIDSKLEFNFVPAYHWSSRFFFDKNISLWGGFVIASGKDNVYFSGDTGFGNGDIFKMIRQTYGEIKLALLPIGAYKPGWFFSSMHISPVEAVKIFQIIGASHAVPLHFDTFQLSDEGYNEPIDELNMELDLKKIEKQRFQQLKPGEMMRITRE